MNLPILFTLILSFLFWSRIGKISQHIVNLPTHTKITEDYVAYIAQFLKKNRDNIYSSFGEIVK